MILTLGTTAPVESVTVPSKVPVTVCACRVPAIQQRKTIVANRPLELRSLRRPGNETAKVELCEHADGFGPAINSETFIKRPNMFTSFFLLKADRATEQIS
jgi:hypothetical protein